MTKSRIIVKFNQEFEAEENIDKVKQIFMCRNPMDEPDIFVEVFDDIIDKWIDVRTL